MHLIYSAFALNVLYILTSRMMITFDGTYATLTVMVCNMEDAGVYKVVFENAKGKDESSGKLVVKAVSTFLTCIRIIF
jgi:hypothetical protein